MMRVERSALLSFTPAHLFALVQDVARYPEFLPGCVAAHVEEVDGPRVLANLRFKFAGMSESFATENLAVKTADEQLVLQMRLLKGPFKSLLGEWRLQPLGESACKVSLAIDLEWGALSLGRLLGPQLERAINNVMQAFKQRAESLQGVQVENH